MMVRKAKVTFEVREHFALFANGVDTLLSGARNRRGKVTSTRAMLRDKLRQVAPHIELPRGVKVGDTWTQVIEGEITSHLELADEHDVATNNKLGIDLYELCSGPFVVPIDADALC
jgi:hypothetical protein